mmetsp:Transcript_71095/g.196853  ORF Transcript_71095/g.196853 Transcript_71095/m.196853 type:complete len:169 (-) Transcript_71095:274-780(-)
MPSKAGDAADAFLPLGHVRSNEWSQRCDGEERVAKRLTEWQGGKGRGYVYESDDVQAVNDFRRTFSMPSFVQPLVGVADEERLSTGSFLPRLSSSRSQASRTPLRTGSSLSRPRQAKGMIEVVLRKEFAKTVEPLKERLRQEQAARRELEERLERLRSGPGAQVGAPT